MDQISNLPKPILHDILSRLPEKDAAKTTILSKSWKSTWSTFPLLVFNEYRYGPKYTDSENTHQMDIDVGRRRNFLDSVDNTLLRFHDQNLAVKQLKLIISLFDHHYMYFQIDQWMKLANKSGVEVLDFSLEYSHTILPSQCYCLPLPTSILEAKSLKKLRLHGGFRLDRVMLNHPVRFTLLQVLSLSLVHFEDEQVLQNLISSCPCIEYLTLNHCWGLNSLNIDCLLRLKELKSLHLLDIVVDAPILKAFIYDGTLNGSYTMPKSDKNTNLRCLCLGWHENTIINDEWLLELFQKFPLLESLELRQFHMSQKIKISSLQLKVLKLIRCCNLEEILIDAPNLYLYDFEANFQFEVPVFSFPKGSSRMKVNVLFPVKNSV